MHVKNIQEHFLLRRFVLFVNEAFLSMVARMGLGFQFFWDVLDPNVSRGQFIHAAIIKWYGSKDAFNDFVRHDLRRHVEEVGQSWSTLKP